MPAVAPPLRVGPSAPAPAARRNHSHYGGRQRHDRPASGEATRLQGLESTDNDRQPVLHRTVAAVRVRVILFDQHSIALPDLGCLGMMGQPHLVKRPYLQTGPAGGALLWLYLARVSMIYPVLGPPPAPWVMHPRSPAGRADRAAPDFPGRLMTKSGRGMESGNLSLGHAVEKIITLIVFCGVTLAEPVMILFSYPLARKLINAGGEGLWRFTQAKFIAALSLATLYSRAALPPPTWRVDADIDELDAVSPHVIFGSRHGSYLGMRSLMPQELTNRTDRIRARLTEAFSPELLDVRDDSYLHEGHAGATPGGGTHYAVRIRSPKLAGLSRVAQHRAVNTALADEFASGLHALQIDAG